MLDLVFVQSSIINILFSLAMFFFAYKDYISYKTKYHKDYKTIITSIGVLGTFVGIYIGLYDFDTSSIKSSVPLLLEGLKVAFLTSIVGMFLSIVLSSIQTMSGKGKLDDSDDTQILLSINTHLEKLSFLETLEKKMDTLSILPDIKDKLDTLQDIDDKLINLLALPLIDEKLDKLSILEDMDDKMINLMALPSIDDKMDIVSSNIEIMSENTKNLQLDISSIKDEMKENQNILIEFLKDSLNQINISLKEAIEQLSQGATEEIIKALEQVIADFNNNLTEQFGDNFKQLNQGVDNMLAWQKNYQTSIKELETLLTKAINGISQTDDKLDNMTQNYQKIDKTHTDLIDIIKTNENQITNIKNNLEGLNEIGIKAKDTANALVDFSKILETSLTSQSQALQKLISSSENLTKELEEQMPKSMQELNTTLTKLTDKFKDDYHAFLQHMKKIMEISNGL